MADNKVLEALLSDIFFSRFDPTVWLNSNITKSSFTENGFPTMALYHHGGQLDQLIRDYQWLGDIVIPSKRHEAAFIFQRDPARNLTIIDSFAKLQFAKIVGSAVMQCGPSCCIYSELFKIVSARKQAVLAEDRQQDRSPSRTEADKAKEVEQQSSTSDSDWDQKILDMQQDFGESWTDFVHGDRAKIQILVNSEDDGYLNHPGNWLNDSRFLGSDQTQDLLKRAMKAFLVNLSKADYYGGRSWTQSAVIESWTKIKKCEDHRISHCISSDLRNILNEIRRGIFKFTNHGRLWFIFSESISSFCLAAGCPKANRREPFECLEILRDVVSRQFIYTADLHNRISELNQQIILQQRMITALAYRHVLESLSAETPGKNATEKWHSFLELMFRNVESDDGKIPPNNPFNNLFDQHKIDKRYPIGYLKEMAKELYSTLSRTIHNFQPTKDFGQYTPMPGQFDPMQIEFLVAMKPDSANLNNDGNPDWEKERARYPGQIDDIGPPIKLKSQTKTTAKNLKKQKKPPHSTADDDEDTILAMTQIGFIGSDSTEPVETRSSSESSSTSDENSESEDG